MVCEMFGLNPVVQVFRPQHLYIGHPRQHPPHEFLASRCLHAHFDPTILAHAELLRRVPLALRDIDREFRLEQQPDRRGLDGSVIYRSAMNVKIQRFCLTHPAPSHHDIASSDRSERASARTTRKAISYQRALLSTFMKTPRSKLRGI